MIHRAWSNQILRFLIVGCFNNLLVYGIYCLFVFIHFDYRVAVLFSQAIGYFISFNTMGRLVFKHFGWHRIVKYVIAAVCMYFVSITLIHFILQLYPNKYLAGFVAAIIVACLSYLLNSKWVFRKVKHDGTN